MSFDLGKFLQNVEVRLHGRVALFVSVLIVLTVMFWLVLRDYTQHPLFSQVFCYLVIGIVILIAAVAHFSKARPEEVPEKSILQIGPVGVFFAKGLSSQEEMVALLRESGGFEKLPPPTSQVVGSAAQKENYRELSSTEAAKFVAKVDAGVQELLKREAQKLSAQIQGELGPQSQLPRIIGGTEPPAKEEPES